MNWWVVVTSTNRCLDLRCCAFAVGEQVNTVSWDRSLVLRCWMDQGKGGYSGLLRKHPCQQAASGEWHVMSTSCEVTQGVGDTWATCPTFPQGVWVWIRKPRCCCGLVLAHVKASFRLFLNESHSLTLASGRFWGFPRKKHRNARGFAQEFLRFGLRYRPSQKLKRCGKSCNLHLKKMFCLGDADFLWVMS